MQPRIEDYAYTSLASYAHLQWSGFQLASHHKKICKALGEVELGHIKRLMIFMPPRHGKSLLASEYFPPWYMGRNPDHQVIHTTYGQELASGFGRKVRNQMIDPQFNRIFPGVTIAQDSTAANRFHTNRNGVYHAVGVGGSITGRGAHLLLIDDPIKGREDADSETMRKKLKEWYQSVAYTRLMPGGAIVLIQCMTGDTPVLMSDSTKKLLKDIRIGDKVSTYDCGRLLTAKVLNWRSNGYDYIYKIIMTSGIIVRANKRHPFLVDDNGEKKWTRLENLKPGMLLVAMKDVKGQQEQKLILTYAHHAKPVEVTTKEILMPPIKGLGIMANIKGNLARLKGVISLQGAITCVAHTTKRNCGLMAIGHRLLIKIHHSVSALNLSIDTALRSMITRQYLASNMEGALYVEENQKKQETRNTGMTSYALTTATKQGKLEGYCVTIATWLLDAVKHLKFLKQPQPISDFTLDKIVSIEEDGIEEVFDIQIDRTENFIANGLVSHNTRWHEDDLAGWLLTEHAHENWTVLSLPAVSDEGDALWPEAYPIDRLATIKQALGSRDWTALYQQKPVPDEGGMIKAAWIENTRYNRVPEGHKLRIVQSWDTAYKPKQINDPSSCTTWLQTTTGDYYLLDVLVIRAEYPAIKRAVLSQYDKFMPDIVLIEDKASGQSLIQEIKQTSIPVAAIEPDGDKETRMNVVSILFETGKVWLPYNASWLIDYEAELFSFPLGKHDDQCDSTSQALSWMRERNRAFSITTPTITTVNAW